MFLSDGLAKGESCVYLTFEDPRMVERRLIDLSGNFKASIREIDFESIQRPSRTEEGRPPSRR
jgi:hypothetical protein